MFPDMPTNFFTNLPDQTGYTNLIDAVE